MGASHVRSAGPREDPGHRLRGAGDRQPPQLVALPRCDHAQCDGPRGRHAAPHAVRRRHRMAGGRLDPGPNRRGHDRSRGVDMARLSDPGLDSRDRGRRDSPAPPGRPVRLADHAVSPPAGPLRQAGSRRLDRVAAGLALVGVLPRGKRARDRRVRSSAAGRDPRLRLGHSRARPHPRLAIERPGTRPVCRGALGRQPGRLDGRRRGAARSDHPRPRSAPANSEDARPGRPLAVVGCPSR